MKRKRILALFLAAVSCLSLAVSASAAGTTTRKATDFKDYDRSAWYAEAVRAAVDNGLLYGKSSTIIDPNGDMTRAEMAAIINRSFGCYKVADISQYKDVAKSKWYYRRKLLTQRSAVCTTNSNTKATPSSHRCSRISKRSATVGCFGAKTSSLSTRKYPTYSVRFNS